jgi:hypothetical protein
MISKVVMIKKVNINMGPIPTGYALIGDFVIKALLWTLYHQSHYTTLNQLKKERSMAGTTCNSHCSQLTGKVSCARMQYFEKIKENL